MSLIPYFVGEFVAHFVELRLVANDQAEVTGAIRTAVAAFEHGEKLMLADLEERVALALVELLQSEDVLIKFDGLRDVVHLDGDVIDAVYLDAHAGFYPAPRGIGCGALGNDIVTRVPWPGRLSSAMLPPARSTARLAIARPSPEPSPLLTRRSAIETIERVLDVLRRHSRAAVAQRRA